MRASAMESSGPGLGAQGARDVPGLCVLHGFGMSKNIHFQSPVLFVDDDALLFCVGSNVAVYDSIKGSMIFVDRGISAASVVTSMAKCPNQLWLAIAEVVLSSRQEERSSQIAIINRNSLSRWKVLNTQRKVDLCTFTSDSSSLVTMGCGPEYVLSYWRLDCEKKMASQETRICALQLLVNPSNACQISISGDGYLRFWQYCATDKTIKEFDALLPLKQEKGLYFVDHCWLPGDVFVAVERHGEIHVFRDAELLCSRSAWSFINKSRRAQEEIGSQCSDQDYMGGGACTTVCCLAPRGSDCFLLGGSGGYLGHFQINSASSEIQCLHTFWLPSRQTFFCVDFSPDASSVVALAHCHRDEKTATAATSQFPSMAKELQRKLGLVSRDLSDVVPRNDFSASDRTQWDLWLFPIGQTDLDFSCKNNFFTLVFPLGNHQQNVSSVAACAGCGIVATLSVDQTAKFWFCGSSADVNFRLVFSYSFSEYDFPVAVCLHPMGLYVVVLFKDRARLYHMLRDSLDVAWTFPLPQLNAQDACFSLCGHFVAIACGGIVLLVHAFEAVVVKRFCLGHLSGPFVGSLIATCLHFSACGDLLFVGTNQGGVVAFCLGGRQDQISNIGIPSMSSVDLNPNGSLSVLHLCYDACRRLVAVFTADGVLRMQNISDTCGSRSLSFCELSSNHPSVKFCSCFLALCVDIVFIGTSTGAVRMYKWPLNQSSGSTCLVECQLHDAPVHHLRFSHDGRFLVSTCADGCVIISSLRADEPGTQFKSNQFRCLSKGKTAPQPNAVKRAPEILSSLPPCKGSPTDYVVVSRKDAAEKNIEIAQLDQQMLSLKTDTKNALSQKDRQMQAKREVVLQIRSQEDSSSTERYSQMEVKLKKAERVHDGAIGRIRSTFKHRRLTAEHEFDERLRKEVAKHLRLEIELQSLQDKHQQKISNLSTQFVDKTQKMKQAQGEALAEWKRQYDLVCQLLRSEGFKCEDALRAKENIFESTISHMEARQRRLLHGKTEQSTTSAQQAVHINSKINILQKTVDTAQAQLDSSNKTMNAVTGKYVAQKDMFCQVEELLRHKEYVLQTKHADLASRRKSQQHLESFRYILYHKVQALESDRDPLVLLVEKYQAEVRDMYNEFVSEFRKKQGMKQIVREGSLKRRNLETDCREINSVLDGFVVDLQRMFQDVDEIASSDMQGGSVTKGLRDVIKKYDKRFRNVLMTQSAPKNTSKIPIATEEVIRQRNDLVATSKLVSDGNVAVNAARSDDSVRFSVENAILVRERNSLRAQKQSLARKKNNLQSKLHAFGSV